jgi:dienelactone hydrolase
MAISDVFIGSAVNAPFPLFRAVSPLVALQLSWVRIASYLAHVYRNGGRDGDEVARARFAPALGAKVALDEWMMALGALREIPRRADVKRIHAEVTEAASLFANRGWLRDPTRYHPAPPPLVRPKIRSERVGLSMIEHVTFDSGYEPHLGEPGRGRWLAKKQNATAHAWMLRHPDGDRPWVVCVHGWRMGSPSVDLAAFRAARLHRRLGFNVVLPVLPLHGPRATGWSGEGFLAGDALDTVHAMAQAMWDVRRVLAWIRAEGAASIGAYGLSLGGYAVALLSTLDSDLDCVIAGIAPSCFVDLGRGHSHPLIAAMTRYSAPPESEARDVMRVISPLAAPPRVPWQNRFLFGGLADRMVPRRQVRALWEHWGRPRLAWYNGSHLSFVREREVARLLREAFAKLGGVAPEPRDALVPRAAIAI